MNQMPSVLVILPAYQPGKIFFRVLDSLKRAIANKPVHVLVLLQDAESIFERYCHQLDFTVISKSFQHLPGNSYQHALRFLVNEIEQKRNEKFWDPEFVMILDKDNLINSDFFERIPLQHFQNFQIIQGCRKALNQENSISKFDTLAEQLNDQLYRQAKDYLGLMVEISGSGALVKTNLFCSAINHLDSNAPGFDKNFMVQILCLHPNTKASYIPGCIIYEEKTSELTAFGAQRLRWFGEQYYNATHYGAALLKASWKQKSLAPLEYWLTLCRPPRSFHLLLVSIFSMLEWAIWCVMDFWVAGVPLFTLSLVFVSMALSIFLVQAPVYLKGQQIIMFVRIALLNVKLAVNSMRPENLGKFIHTPHKHE